MKDRISGQYVRFVVTGLYRPRQVSSEYWNLNEIALTGSSTASGFTTYGPLAVQAGGLRRASRASRAAGRLRGFLAGPAADGERSRRRARHRGGPGGRPAAGAGERRAASGPRPHHQPALGAQRHREQPGCRPLAAGHQRRAALPARRGGPARGGAAARGPARGRVRDADGTRRHPLAAGPADRGRGHPAVPALVGGRRRGRRPARRAARRDRFGRRRLAGASRSPPRSPPARW